MTSIITRFGALGVFMLMVPESACIPIPSEATLIFSGVAVRQGLMSLPLAIVAATAGNVVGSALAYALGASRALDSVPFAGNAIERWGALLDRHGTKAVFLARLLPLARTFVALPAGARRVSPGPFVLLTACGSALWAAGFTLLGMVLAHAWQSFDSLLGRGLLAGGLLILLVTLKPSHKTRGGATCEADVVAGSTTPVTGDEVVSVEHLRVRYGETLAVEDVSLSISRGEIFGILGPNGAGKTTTVECVGGLRHGEAGAIRVLGLDVRAGASELHERVGIQLQTSELPEKLRVREALELFAAFYPSPHHPAELLRSLGLEEKADTRYGNLSGGQKQRLSIALALIGRPELAILDELTTRLDPQSRRETWRLIEGIRDQGVTVILVTHFMEEAEYLCDRVAVMHHGRIRASGTPASLSAELGQRISFRLPPQLDLAAVRLLPDVRDVHEQGERVVVEGGEQVVDAVIGLLVREQIAPEQVRVEQSTLDDAFVAMTAEADAELAATSGGVA